MFQSIHKRLLAWLVIPLLFISSAHLFTSYIEIQNTSEKIFDKLLMTLAVSISEYTLSSGGDILTDDIIELIRLTTNDNFYYKVIGPDSIYVTGYTDIPEPPEGIRFSDTNIQYYDATYLNQPVRVIAFSIFADTPEYTGWMTTFLAQTIKDRNEYVSSGIWNVAIRLLVTIFITTALLSIGISLGLKPLERLQSSVNRRDSHDLSPIKTKSLPTEVRDVVKELNSLLTRVRDHLAITKRFIENAAHQLRTPVTALLPQTQLALREAKSERERDTLTKLNKSALNIARLTQQLLSLTYAESIALEKKEFSLLDISTIARSNLDAIKKQHPERKFSQKLSAVHLMGISVLLGEVVKNLLDNAIKYSPNDSVISIRTFAHKNACILEVSDKGPGIPDEFRDKVLERFYRLSKNNDGSGLGLAIVSEIVSSHRGELEILEGAKGVGTTFRCVFPQEK